MNRWLCLVGIVLLSCDLRGSEPHRVVVVSGTDDRQTSEVRLVEVETARTLASLRVGDTAEAALSPQGDVLAVISQYSVAGMSQPRRRLELFRTSDLSLITRGYVPVPTNVYKRVPSWVRAQFSPDAKELVVQKMDGHDAVLTRVRLELDEAGVFQVIGQPITLSGARGVNFLRLDWPKVTVWSNVAGTLYVLDLDTNARLHEWRIDPLADVPIDYPRRHPTGAVVTADEKYGYYVPHQHGRSNRPIGHLRRIDLAADPPKVIHTSTEPQPGLKSDVVAVSEIAGALVVAERKLSETAQLPSPLIRVFHALTLTPAPDIKCSLTDCDCVAISQDGKYLYAVDFAGGMSVVETATGKEFKVLMDVGAHPALVVPLP